MSVFNKESRQDVEIYKYRILKRATFALIQILQWVWTLENRTDFKSILDKYVSFVDYPDDIYDIILKIF